MAEKIDPFKRETAKPEPLKRHSPLDGEITIKLSPRRLLRGSLLILMLVVVFYAGRLLCKIHAVLAGTFCTSKSWRWPREV